MKDRIEVMLDVVREAGELLLDREEAARINRKGHADFVTDVDYHVQKKIAERLSGEFPEIQFMGEEKDNSCIDFGGSYWILDPVDGTTNLIHDMRTSAISLGLAEGDSIVAGVIYQPYTKELFWAEKGKGAYLNGDRITVSGSETMEDSLISLGTAPYYEEYVDWTFRAARLVFERVQDIRRSGSAAVELAYVACGRLEGTFERILQPWDYAAGCILVEEAGGRLTDLDGRPVSLRERSSVAASNGRIHAELLETLQRA